jgi:glycosyltransferase involved in cell wall biosynthesis
MRDSRKTIVHIANSGKIGGANKVLMSLVTGIDRDRFRPVVVAPVAGKLTDWAAANSIACHTVAASGSGRYETLRRAAQLAWVFGRERAQLFHAHSPWSYREAGLAGRMTGVKRVCHLHFPIAWKQLVWPLGFGVDAVVTCYQKLAKELSNSRPSTESFRLRAISNTVDVERFTPAAEGSLAARSKWHEGADHVVVIVGHLSDIKGYPTFLEAAARVLAMRPRTRFLAVGETATPGYKDMLHAKAQSLGLGASMEFLGWRQDVPEILRSADLMVLPSLAEGLPLAVLEAMASGLPVVASDVDGTPEAVIEGETGLLVRPNDPDAVASKVLQLLADPELRTKMGAAGRERTERLFTMRPFVTQVENLYEELLAS